jgi:hypothetical protein
LRQLAQHEMDRRISADEEITSAFEFCLLLHLWYKGDRLLIQCGLRNCECKDGLRKDVIAKAIADGERLSPD